jgi:hypothetical protein
LDDERASRILTAVLLSIARRYAMVDVSFDDEEAALLREMLITAYRLQHREHWEVVHFGEPTVLPDATSRLKALEVLLLKFGVSADEVMR